MSLFDYSNFYLVGIKGVALTSLAQLLLDAGKNVSGSDVSEHFVTQDLLEKLNVRIGSFSDQLPADTDAVVYTAAHQGSAHPQVQAAINLGIPVFSHAEALGFFFNQKQGIAVCGVGGKSTVSAMIAWILEKRGLQPSYSVGVGKIVGLEKTGVWQPNSNYFIAEADEYAANPHEVAQGQPLIPRFSYLKPSIAVCTHFKFDHPDVYQNEAHSQQVFAEFLAQVPNTGTIILNEVDVYRWPQLSARVLTFGESDSATLRYSYNQALSVEGKTVGTITVGGHSSPITLQIPGKYNLENAAVAILTVLQLGVSLNDSVAALANFQSTARRFEHKGSFQGAELFDDYAHHPSELAAVIHALHDWYPSRRKIVVFQPHTYSRTKSLFMEFAQVLSEAKELILLDIFASAREKHDASISSQQLAQTIQKYTPQLHIPVLHDYHALSDMLASTLQPGDVCLTLGAGDVYKALDVLLSDAGSSSTSLDK